MREGKLMAHNDDAQNETKVPVAAKSPDEASRELNKLFSATFDSVLRIEEHALDNRLTAGLTISELHTIAAVGLYESKPMKRSPKRCM